MQKTNFYISCHSSSRLLDHDFRSYRDKILRERAQETGDTFANLLKQMQKSKLATDLDWFPIEACRTRNQFVFTPLLVASGIAMGWTFQAGVHISAPILFQFMFGVLQVGVMSTSSVLSKVPFLNRFDAH